MTKQTNTQVDKHTTRQINKQTNREQTDGETDKRKRNR